MTTVAEAQPSTETMPQIAFGPHQLSRLIAGANTINGGSHLSRFVNLQMKRYFTPERVMTFLAECQALGINTWQSGPQNLDLYRRHRAEGGQLHYISLARDDPDDPQVLARIAATGAIATRLVSTTASPTTQAYFRELMSGTPSFTSLTFLTPPLPKPPPRPGAS